jgi:hypothetical protein
MVQLIIKRTEAEFINGNPGWSLIFGRRKVGKTFMVEHFVKHDVYFSVNIDRTVRSKDIEMGFFDNLDAFSTVVINLLRKGKTCVIDEFQRLPLRTLEEIARAHPNGRLILTGSSMRTTTKIIGGNSPLLGIVLPSRLGLVRPKDLLFSLSGALPPHRAIELAPVLRDPWTMQTYAETAFFDRLVRSLHLMVPVLIGEIFMDEERSLTQVYASILSLIGAGHHDTWQIAQTLKSKRIIKTGSSANVLPYMNNMVEMGLLERTRQYGKRAHIYSVVSFPMGLYYYLDSRYEISSREVSYSEVKPTVESQLRLGIEGFLADLFAEELGGRKELIKDFDREIDLLVTVRNRPKLVGEVKWGRATKGDVSYFLSKVEDLECRKVFVTLEPIDTDEVEVLTPGDIVRMAGGNRAGPRKGRGQGTPRRSRKVPTPRRKG